jgi:ESCRT-II complex subunit VPS36
MDRLLHITAQSLPGETGLLHKQVGVKIYDGDSRSNIDDGTLELTSHRMLMKAENISLDLFRIILLEKEEGGFMRSDKLVLHLSPLSEAELSMTRPFTKHKADFIKLSFRSGGQTEFFNHLQKAMNARAWAVKKLVAPKSAKREMRAGITGIEKKLSQKARQDKANISKAFGDLDKLMEMAKPMVSLAKSISSKIRDRQGEITEDETVQFKSYLLSLGIDDPVTKDSAGSDKAYYQGLAKEMFLVLDQPIQEAGGMMTLTDAFVRLNRARGLELVSPDDLLQACRALSPAKLPMDLHTFPSGVLVLRTSNHNPEEARQNLLNLVESHSSLTAEELSQNTQGLSVVLGKERLLDAENDGYLVRDDSVEGLRFYPNLFLSREP